MNLFPKDMDDNQFWLTVLSLMFAMSMVIASSIVFYFHNKNLMITELVIKNYSPMELTCLFEDGAATKIPCLILSQKQAGIIK